MKLVASLIFIGGLLASSTAVMERDEISQRCIRNSITTVECPENMADDSLLAHPDDCGLFYYCTRPLTPPICRDCPATLHFNPTKKVCDRPETAGCLA